MNSKKSKGDKCPPCGTPENVLKEDDTLPETITCCVLPVR